MIHWMNDYKNVHLLEFYSLFGRNFTIMLTAMTFLSVFKIILLRKLFGVLESPCVSLELKMKIGVK